MRVDFPPVFALVAAADPSKTIDPVVYKIIGIAYQQLLKGFIQDMVRWRSGLDLIARACFSTLTNGHAGA